MTALEWDKVGERTFQTGVDRGVLYLPSGGAVPWNGLTQVTEERTREVKSYYIDGVKFLDHHVPGSFAAKLTAITYPDELDELLGDAEFAPGVVIHDQKTGLFNLSYRTLIGNDVDGMEHGYRIHILYNIQAVPDDVAFNTVGDNVAPSQFGWKLTGTPASMFGIRPTSHISLDSRRVDPGVLETLENLLYGTAETAPELPNIVAFLGMVEV